MKKLISLIKASMTEGMNVIKVSGKKKGKSSIILPLILTIYLMFAIGSGTGVIFDILSKDGRAHLLLPILAFSVSLLTIIEGVYKAGPLIFNCKDDDLLLSLPISRRTILFIRIFKFYVFELLFNSLFLFPIMLAYIRWADNLTWTYFLTSFIMLLFLPIIPIVLSCFFGAISSSISSRFKHKNLMQIVTSMVWIIAILALSYKTENLLNYLIEHANSLNDLITKIYYPAGLYANLVTNFKILDLLKFISINIILLIISIYILSIFYFKINSRVKKVITNKNTIKKNVKIKQQSKTKSLVKKELNTFFQTPVFIINSGFALVLFLLIVIMIVYKFDSVLPILTSKQSGLGLSKDLIMDNLSIIIFILVSFTAYMTSMTNSIISLEGRNINILKSLPIKPKKILMSKIYSCLVITTPVLVIGDLILFIKFKTNIISSILILLLSILIPLVSHFIGIIVNLKYPKLDAESSTEVVKQSTSSFIAVMIGMLLAILTIVIITKIIGKIDAIILLVIITIVYIIINCILYLYLINIGEKDFNKLTI